jgi:GntR family transcriptional regulator
MSAGADWQSLRVDGSDVMPLYHQLKPQIREQAKRLEPDTMIPSEKELMDLSGVGRATVRRAISDLAQEGSPQAHQGRGTFTARPCIEAAPSRPRCSRPSA